MKSVTDIIWDTNGLAADEDLKEQLPAAVEVPDNIDKDDIADWLSDHYGWCVESFVIDA
jgi:hypothetical protein